ncbi:MAG: sulfatase-like hydrolase/transferase [Opitutales bacterium]
MKSLVILFSSFALLHSSFAADKPPNILFILADDQSPFDLKAYDPNSPLQTPNIDRLAAAGMVFDGAYHMGAFVGAVCRPSRHMIMSGRTVWHLSNSPGATEKGLCPPDLERNTLPAVFNRAGYSTMRTCKTGNSYEAANRLFTVRHDAMKRGGSHETGSGWHGDRVLDYLEEREAEKEPKPFLIYFGFSHPHDSTLTGQRNGNGKKAKKKKQQAP